MTRSAFALCCFALTSCKLVFSAPVPMASAHFPAASAPAKCLLVFMPGAGDSASDFEKEQFVSLIRAQPLSVDLVAANATLGYYMRGIVSERVETDVVVPADPSKYSKVWMVGISMGGMGTLMYAHDHPARLQGALLLAPYLGDEKIADEVEAAGGLAKWTAPPNATLTEDNYQRQAWGYLQRVIDKTEPGPELYLGFGKDDSRVGQSAAILAAAIPADHRLGTDGGHDWGPWRALWSQFLQHSSFATDCRRP